MIEFAKRLSNEQIEDFFDGTGEIMLIKPSASEDMLDIIFKKEHDRIFWYSISDNYISAYGFHKTSEDWKFYMSEIFGESYLEKYTEEPVENSFISKLSLDDIKKILIECKIVPDVIEEQKAFRKGTRRFKVKIDVPAKSQIEVIFGPHIDFCSGISSLTERMFMEFFSKRFGMDFINYYIDVEKQIAEKKIEAFKNKCHERVIGKLNYMVRIMENKGE